jgi:IS4 transposase
LAKAGSERERLLIEEHWLKRKIADSRKQIEYSDRICDWHERVTRQNDAFNVAIQRLRIELGDLKTEMLERLDAEERRQDRG